MQFDHLIGLINEVTFPIKIWFNLLHSEKPVAYKCFQMAMSFIMCKKI